MDFTDVPTVQLVTMLLGLDLLLDRESEYKPDVVRTANNMWATLATLLKERAANGDFRAVGALDEIGAGW